MHRVWDVRRVGAAMAPTGELWQRATGDARRRGGPRSYHRVESLSVQDAIAQLEKEVLSHIHPARCLLAGAATAQLAGHRQDVQRHRAQHRDDEDAVPEPVAGPT